MAHYNRGRPHSALGPGIPDPRLADLRVKPCGHRFPVGYHHELFKEMIENVYRYEQFYGNTFLALLFCSILRYLVGNAAIIQSKSDMVIFGALLGSSVAL